MSLELIGMKNMVGSMSFKVKVVFLKYFIDYIWILDNRINSICFVYWIN